MPGLTTRGTDVLATLINAPLCHYCKRLRLAGEWPKSAAVCDSCPEGISRSIFFGSADYRKPIAGANCLSRSRACNFGKSFDEKAASNFPAHRTIRESEACRLLRRSPTWPSSACSTVCTVIWRNGHPRGGLTRADGSCSPAADRPRPNLPGSSR